MEIMLGGADNPSCRKLKDNWLVTSQKGQIHILSILKSSSDYKPYQTGVKMNLFPNLKKPEKEEMTFTQDSQDGEKKKVSIKVRGKRNRTDMKGGPYFTVVENTGSNIVER